MFGTLPKVGLIGSLLELDFDCEKDIDDSEDIDYYEDINVCELISDYDVIKNCKGITIYGTYMHPFIKESDLSNFLGIDICKVIDNLVSKYYITKNIDYIYGVKKNHFKKHRFISEYDIYKIMIITYEIIDNRLYNSILKLFKDIRIRAVYLNNKIKEKELEIEEKKKMIKNLMDNIRKEI